MRSNIFAGVVAFFIMAAILGIIAAFMLFSPKNEVIGGDIAQQKGVGWTEPLTKGNRFANITVQQEDYYGRNYQPECLTECHLPLTFIYDGSNLPSTYTINTSVFNRYLAGGSRNFYKSELQYLNVYDIAIPTYSTVCSPEVIITTNLATGQPSAQNCTTVQTGTENKTIMRWEAVNGNIELKKGVKYYFDFISYDSASLDKKGVDVVPRFKIASQEYNITELAWANSSWTKRKQINVSGGDNLEINFTKFINITWETGMQTDFDDVLFIDGVCSGTQTNQMYHDWGRLIDSNSAHVYLRFQTFNPGEDNNSVCMYFGNAGATNMENEKNAWDDYTMAVYPFSETSGTNIKESKNSFNMTLTGSPPFGNSSIGGTSIRFYGGSAAPPAQYGTVAHNALFNQLSYTYTITAMVRADVLPTGAYRAFLTKGDAANRPFASGQNNANPAKWYIDGYNPTVFTISTTSIDENKWTYYISNHNSTGTYLWINASRDGAAGGTTTPLATNTDPIRIYYGLGETEGGSMNGSMSFLRLDNVSRSSSWIRSSYQNFNMTSFTFGTTESGGSTGDTTPPVVTLNAPATGATVYTSTVSLNSTLSDNINVSNGTLYVWIGDAIQNISRYGLNKTNGTLNISYTFNKSGTYKWNVYAIDNSSNKAWATANFTISYAVYPTFSNPTESPSEPQTYSSSQVYRFNITVNLPSGGADDIDRLYLNFNGTNYSAWNITSSFPRVYNVSIAGLHAANYTYYWWANTTTAFANTSATYSYNISKASPSLSITILPSASVINGTQTNVTGFGCPLAGACNLSMNGTLLANNSHNTTLPAGIYTYVFNITQTQNYTVGTTSSILTVSSSAAPVNISIIYPVGTVGYWRKGTNLTLNWTVTENAAACWANDKIKYAPIEAYSYYDAGGGFTNPSFPADGDWSTVSVADTPGAYFIWNFTSGYTDGVFGFKGWNTGGVGLDSGAQLNFSCYNNAGGWTQFWQRGFSKSSSIATSAIPSGCAVNPVSIMANFSYDSLGNGAQFWEANYTDYHKGQLNLTCLDNNITFNPYSNVSYYMFAKNGNDTLTINLTSWDYIITEENLSYNSSTYETKNEAFFANLTIKAGYTASANLIYGGTSYSMTNTGSNTLAYFTRSTATPITNVNQTIKNWYVSVSLSNATGTYNYNSSTYTQTVNELRFARCNDTYPFPPIVNYSFVDEDNQTAVNTTSFQGTWTYRIDGTASKNYSHQNNELNDTYSFCANVNNTLTVTANIVAGATGYTTKTSTFSAEQYNNVSTLVKYIYLLSGYTNVIIQVRNYDMTPLEGYYVEIYRYYPGTDSYLLTTSERTDLYGQMVAQLVQNTVKYKFIFKDTTNATVKTSTGVFIACKATPCILPFIIEDTTDDFERFKNVTDYTWTFNWNNNTQTFLYSWNDGTGATATKRIYVERTLWNGTTVVCNTTSTNAIGSLSCNVGSGSGTYLAQAYRRVSGGSEKIIAQLNTNFGNNANKFGRDGILWSFFLLMTCLAFGYWKPTAGAVFYGAGILFIMITGIVYVNPAIVIAQIAILAVFLWAFKG